MKLVFKHVYKIDDMKNTKRKTIETIINNIYLFVKCMITSGNCIIPVAITRVFVHLMLDYCSEHYLHGLFVAEIIQSRSIPNIDTP